MTKLFRVTYSVYFEMLDLPTAQKVSPLYCSRITNILRKNGWIEDKITVAICDNNNIVEVTKAEHKKALAWTPPNKCWQGMSKQLQDQLAGAYFD